MHQVASTKQELSSVYERFRRKNAEELIICYLQKKAKCEPELFFGKEAWIRLRFAIDYRNLLAHECTYLGQDKYPDLLTVCHEVLMKLADAEGIQFEAT